MIYMLLPAYNEEKSLDQLLPKIDKAFKEDMKLDYHIIVCNDGSRDKTGEKLEEYSKTLPMTIITHKINRGLGETSRDLFEKAAELSKDEDIIIRMDCDDTHEPEFIPKMLQKIEEGYDVVIASRFVEGGGQEGLSSYRATISKLANLFMKFFFPIDGLKEYSSGFRAYRAKAIKYAINTFGNQFIQLKGLGFTATLEKVVKLKIIGAKFGESPFVLRYQQKQSESKMVSSITTFGYGTLALLYHWPWGGWRRGYKNIKKLHEEEL
ncbi:glycosyltransferase family 2 protein [Aliarcobacter butzleri]|uniref:glycosyltransferase family 2 protein n=1 Tax=Aliarcobacter butzleri TaxID=28197 RepID=UPI002B23EF69|nr:glycosyltransferase family 2 protein [Aliarcobacter butzleri]